MILNTLLNSVVNKHVKDELPIFHTTLYEHVKNILDNGISPRYCNVFKINLAYFFYGRSTYIKDNYIRKDFLKEADIKLAVSFGIDIGSLNDRYIYNIFPFDSGAYANELFNPHISGEENIADYSIKIENINSFIELFYGSNENYINGNPLKHVDIPIELKGLSDLIHDRITERFDSRARSVEISSTEHIKSNEIKFMFVHIRLKNNPDIQKMQNKNPDLKFLYYTTEEIGTDHDMYLLLKNKIKEFVMENYL